MKKSKFIFVCMIIFIQFLSVYCFADNKNNLEQVNETATPSLNSISAILMEESTGHIVYEKNAYEKMFPASTTKIMTAILVLEHCNLSDIVTINANSLKSIPEGYVIGNILPDEELSIENLLYCLMLKSANDVAVVLADFVSGSVENFSKLMNEKALEIGCKNTNFVNPNGIHDDNHYSTAYDLALIAKYCMKNETFKKLVSTENYSLPKTNKYLYDNRTFNNTNELILHDSSLYYQYATGIKTGYTKEAGNCLISSSTKNNINYISVVLGGTSTIKNVRFTDTQKLFDFGFENFDFIEFKKNDEIIKQIQVENATEETKNLNLKIENSLSAFTNINFDFDSLVPKIDLNDNITAPIKKDDVLGNVTYTIDNQEYSSKLLACSDVEVKNNYAFIIIIIGSVLLILGFFILILNNHKKKKITRKKRKRI